MLASKRVENSGVSGIIREGLDEGPSSATKISAVPKKFLLPMNK